MKKNLKVVLTSLMLASTLTGCNSNGNSNDNTSTKPDNSTVISSEATSVDTTHDPVKLTYAAWNLGNADSEVPNLERLMLKEFTNKYPWISVEVLERPKVAGTNDDTNWNEFLSSRAAIKKLPDVFLADTIPQYITNGWVRDLSDQIKDDTEYNMLSEEVRNAAVYDGMTLALPIAIYYHGYVVNKTLYDERNGIAPTYDTSWDEFLEDLADLADHKAGGNGIAGLIGIEHIIHYYPSLLNSNYQWFTFDGEKFNLDSQEFKDTMAFYTSVYDNNKYCFDGLNDEQKLNFFGTGDTSELMNNGSVLASWYGSYSLGSLQAKIESGEWDRELDFIGLPAGKDAKGNTIKRTMASMDFNVVASTTKYPEEAYMLAKWMGFGKDGYAKRLELSRNTDGIDPLSFAPLIPDKELLDSFFELYPGWDSYREVVEKQSVVIESLKFQVGYNECRYKGTYDSEFTMYDIIASLLTGTRKIADIATSLNERINEIYTTNYSKFEEALNKYYKK